MVQNGAMSDMRNPFDSIESAQEFLGLLSEAIEEAMRDVAEDRETGLGEAQERRVQALDLALYKLRLLDEHVGRSLKILKDLRSVRRILVGERPEGEEKDQFDEAPPETAGRFGV
jgi:aromatic ring-cleaving dioxygenase